MSDSESGELRELPSPGGLGSVALSEGLIATEKPGDGDQPSPSQDLKRKTAEGVTWTSASTGVRIACQLLQTAVLARLVGPRLYGVMAMATIVIATAQAFTDGGISAAVVHKQTLTKREQSSLYWLNVLFSAITFGAVAAAVPLTIKLFKEPQLGPVLFFTGLTLLLSGTTKQFEMLLQRDLRFDKLAQAEVSSQIASMLVSIPLALAGLGLWSLVIGFLGGAAARSLVLAQAGIRSYRPDFQFDWAATKPFVSFGAYQIGERVANFLGSRLDQVVIGSLLGPKDLGLYNLSFSLVLAPVTLINPILTRVAFPLLAKTQDELTRLKVIFFSMVRALGIITAGALLLGVIAAPAVFPRFLGSQWTSAIPIFQALCAASYFRSVSNPLGSLFLAKGRADMGFLFTLSVIPVALVSALLGGKLGGVLGVAIAMSSFHPLFWFPEYRLTRSLVGPCAKEFFVSTCVPGLIASLALGIAYLGPGSMRAGAFLTVGYRALVAGGLYCAATVALNRTWLMNMRRVAQQSFPFSARSRGSSEASPQY